MVTLLLIKVITTDRVRFVGHVPRNLMAAHLALIDIGVVADDRTGYASPMKLVECTTTPRAGGTLRYVFEAPQGRQVEVIVVQVGDEDEVGAGGTRRRGRRGAPQVEQSARHEGIGHHGRSVQFDRDEGMAPPRDRGHGLSVEVGHRPGHTPRG